jgi:hypothetical protein
VMMVSVTSASFGAAPLGVPSGHPVTTGARGGRGERDVYWRTAVRQNRPSPALTIQQRAIATHSLHVDGVRMGMIGFDIACVSVRSGSRMQG